MSEQDTKSKRGQRAAVVILSAVAAGAMVGLATVDPGTPIRDQFQAAYIAGPGVTDMPNNQIILGG